MSCWIPDDDRGLIEQPFIQHGRTCIHCGGTRPPEKVDDDGWCDDCTGRGPSPEELARRCEVATLSNARKVLARKLREQDPEHEIAWWRERIATLEKVLGIEPEAV